MLRFVRGLPTALCLEAVPGSHSLLDHSHLNASRAFSLQDACSLPGTGHLCPFYGQLVGYPLLPSGPQMGRRKVRILMEEGKLVVA